MENSRSGIPWKGKNKFLIERKLSIFNGMKAHSIVFHLMEWKHLENREKYVIYNIKPHLFFQWEWRDESPTDNVTKKKKIIEEIQKQKLDWENWNNYQRNGERHVYFLRARTLCCFDFAVLFHRFVWKKTVYSCMW